MALDINGYNATFNAFVKFADDSMRTNAKAVARFGEGGAEALEGRTVVAVDPKTDKVGKVGRSLEQKDINNKIRTAFRDAIINMFGGEKNIPKSVMKAMLMSDYGKGKPLTARRIMAVKQAIDATGVMKQKGAEEVLQPSALAKGYSKGEMPKLAKAANLLAQVKGCSVEQAFEEVSTPGSKANRLMNYGGRFMQNAENFKNGLRLLDSFSAWFDETGAALKKIYPNTLESHIEEGMSKTLLNGHQTMFSGEYKLPAERFVFEEIANNPAVNLAEKDANKLFSMENNQAMGSIARSMLTGRTQTVAQIPPEKRTTFFKAMNMIRPLVSTADEARVPPSQRHAIKGRNLDAPVARLLKNLDQLIALDSQKKLTAKNLVKLCFPEIKKPSEDPISDVVDLVNQWDEDISVGGDKYPDEDIAAMNEAMKATGCSEEEAAQIAKGKLQLPNVPYFSSGTLGLEHGTAAARNQLIGDLDRGIGYNYTGGQPLLKTAGFRFNLPGGESLFANKTQEFKGNIPVIADKLEALCGPAHKAQATSLFMMTCQAGLGPLLGGLKSYGVESTEHSSVDFTITKNNDTGDISIRYSSPKELPFSFEWTATIKPDGYVSSTPIRFTDAETLARETAKTADTLKNLVGGLRNYDVESVAKDIKYFVEHPKTDPKAADALRAFLGKKGSELDLDAVVNTADKFMESCPNLKTLKNSVKTAKKWDLESAGKAIDRLVEDVKGDADLMALLQAKGGAIAKNILLNSDNQVRSYEEISKRIEGLRANVDELRSAAGGDKRVLDAGIRQLLSLEGKSLPSGIITQIVDLAAKADVSALKGLSGRSSPLAIVKAMCTLDRIITDICNKTEVMKSFDGGSAEEASFVNSFVMGIIFAKMDSQTLNGVKEAMYSDASGDAKAMLDRIDKGKLPQGLNINANTRVAMSNVAHSIGWTLRFDLGAALNDALGGQDEAEMLPTNYEDEVVINNRTFKEVANLIENLTNEVHSVLVERAELVGQ